MYQTNLTSLNAQRTSNLALCNLSTELPSDAAGTQWLLLIPVGPVIVGRDGRRWLFDRPQDVLDASMDGHRDIPIDWNHATELQAPKGEVAPAAAWIVSLSIREGALWGLARWTKRGQESIASGEYRYLSPAFRFDPETGRIARLTSVGLTNSPNFRLPALNHDASAHVDSGGFELGQEALRIAELFGNSIDELQAVAARESKGHHPGQPVDHQRLAELFGNSPEELAKYGS